MYVLLYMICTVNCDRDLPPKYVPPMTSDGWVIRMDINYFVEGFSNEDNTRRHEAHSRRVQQRRVAT